MFKNHIISTYGERISSPFGLRKDPITGKQAQHNGIDIIDLNGLQQVESVNILAYDDGRVVYAGFSKEIGNYVDISHAGKLLTRYFHMKRLLVKSGQTVKAGQEIGIMGTTGRSTGIHLHFGVKENSTSYLNGTYVDPMPYLEGENDSAISTPSKPSKPTAKTYTVKRGDSWWGIASKQLGKGSRYEELAKFNGKTSKSTIYAGQVIKLP